MYTPDDKRTLANYHVFLDGIVDAISDVQPSAQGAVTRTLYGIGETESTVAVSRYEADNCVHCHASYGHKRTCPLLNRTVAEERSRLFQPTDGDRITAHGLGVLLD